MHKNMQVHTVCVHLSIHKHRHIAYKYLSTSLTPLCDPLLNIRYSVLWCDRKIRIETSGVPPPTDGHPGGVDQIFRVLRDTSMHLYTSMKGLELVYMRPEPIVELHYFGKTMYSI
jgi:hypothetical protein